MGKNFNIIVPCSEANHVCDKSQYKEASIWEKIKLNIHLVYCRACRKYTKNNSTLTKLLNKSNTVVLDKANKERMREDFEKALKNKSL